MSFFTQASQPQLALKERLHYLLASFEFKEADKFYVENIGSFWWDLRDFEALKASHLNLYFSKYYSLSFNFDSEQSEAIASIHKNTLVTARAWSWKTQVIAWKIAYLIEREKIESNQMLVLSFNRKAAKEVNKRVQKFGEISKIKNQNLLNFNCAQTFHWLAYKLLKKDIDWYRLLLDTKKITDPETQIEKEYTTNERVRFIQKCFLDIYSLKLKDIFELYLSHEMRDFKYYYIEDDMKYLESRKKLKNTALSGDYVRSFWERLIIDLLVEYWFDVKYESYMHIWKNETKPDIVCTLNWLKRKIVIEHWGDFNRWDTISKMPIWKSISGNQYQDTKERKVKFWKEQERLWKCYFIQTYSKDIDYHNHWEEFKNSFLKHLQAISKNETMVLTKISFTYLISILRENNKYIFSFTKKLENFINKAQQRKLSFSDVGSYIGNCKDLEEKAFLQVALEVYKVYRTRKEEKKYLDFSDLLNRAKSKIEKMEAKNTFVIWEYEVNLRDIKYIIIDEYQDFSTLFYQLLEQVLKFNPECKLFVVWDSLQSINAFAGSELQYYIDFRNKFFNESTSIKTISTNYRSKESIVTMWNNLMKFLGEKDASWLSPKNDWWEKIALEQLDKKTIEDDILDKIFKSDDTMLNQTWKALLFKIISIINKNKWKKIMLLSRNNKVFWFSLLDLNEKLYNYYSLLLLKKVHNNETSKYLSDEGKEMYKKISDFINFNIEFLTVHKSKWKEADIVILLDPSERNFPSSVDRINTDTKYSYIFEISEDSILQDERRLFYVAITRAKEKIYFISNKQITSLSNTL